MSQTSVLEQYDLASGRHLAKVRNGDYVIHLMDGEIITKQRYEMMIRVDQSHEDYLESKNNEYGCVE